MAKDPSPGAWVLLLYRLPREPSTPRITVWRKLKQLGVGQLADGLVALPADARTREQLEWIAQDVVEAGGDASIWLGQPATREQEQRVIAAMTGARQAEYEQVTWQARQALAGDERDRLRSRDRLRAQLRRIARRDFFPSAHGESAQLAVQALADEAVPGGGVTSAAPDPSATSGRRRR